MKGRNEIKIGSLHVSSSDVKIDKLVKIVDRILSKHKNIIKQPRNIIEDLDSDSMFG